MVSLDLMLLRRTLWSRKWQPAPVFLPGKLHGQRSLEATVHGGAKDLDTAEQLSTHTQQETAVCLCVLWYMLVCLVL